MPEWPEPVYAYIVFSRFPDHDGSFEIEIYCEARYDIESLSLELNYSEEIVLDKPVPAYSASFKKEEKKVWRYTGRVRPYKDIPPSLSLFVQYKFPYEAVREDIEKKYSDNHSNRNFLLERLEKFKGKTETILKALSAQLPEKEKKL
jgi:hypothetical protein